MPCLLRVPLAACALLVPLSACPSQEVEPGEDCLANMPSADLSTLPSRSVALGMGGAEGFHAWNEGEAVPIEIGSQGFTMITPSIRLGDSEGDDKEICYWVNLEPVSSDGTMSADGVGWFQGGMVFKGAGGTRIAGPIFSPLESGNTGEALYFRLTVASEDFAAQQLIGVVVE